MLSHLPQELVDLVVDQLADNMFALRACSLTCRSLFARTRHHLFAEMTLKDATGFTKFTKMIKRSPAIASCVRTLCITKSHGRPNKVDREFPLLLPKLPGVTELVVLDWITSQMLVRTRNHLAESLRNVRVLHLGNHVSITGEDLCVVLSACSRLGTISLHKLDVLEPYVPSSDLSCPADTLKLSRFSNEMLLPLMGLGLPMARLDLTASISDDSEVITSLLQRSGARLTHLALSLSPGVCQIVRAWARELSLSENPGLSSLELVSFNFTSTWSWPPNSTNFYAYVLSKIEAFHTRLRVVRFTLLRNEIGVPWSLRRLPETAPVATAGWGDVDEQLVRIAKEHPNVEVVFSVRCSTSVEQSLNEHVEDTTRAVAKALPNFTTGGYRFKINCGMSWKPNLEFSGGLQGPVRGRRFPQ